jgi:hypothetical protein
VKNEMTKTKIILLAVALSLVVMAAVGVTFAQYVNTQNLKTAYSQSSQGYTGNSGYLSPNCGYGYSQVPQQGAYPYRTGMGMGMMGRFW